MNLLEIIPEERIFLTKPDGTGKIHLLEDFMHQCIDPLISDVSHRESVWETLKERELSMSTGIGLGVAIPHCSSVHIEDVIGGLCLLEDGIDFESVDEIPVRIIVLLLLPKNRFERHIKTLASVAKLFNNSGFREKLLECRSRASAAETIRNQVLGLDS
jgi:mannitol/fructose-specific phosphotransferase system IIA component (Ntr-type)